MLRALLTFLAVFLASPVFAAGLGFNPFDKPSPTSPTSPSAPNKPGPSVPSGPAQKLAPIPAPASPQKSELPAPAKGQSQQPKNRLSIAHYFGNAASTNTDLEVSYFFVNIGWSFSL